jgi:hypothetical protein
MHEAHSPLVTNGVKQTAREAPVMAAIAIKLAAGARARVLASIRHHISGLSGGPFALCEPSETCRLQTSWREYCSKLRRLSFCSLAGTSSSFQLLLFPAAAACALNGTLCIHCARTSTTCSRLRIYVRAAKTRVGLICGHLFARHARVRGAECTANNMQIAECFD